MKALVLHAVGDLRLQEVEVPAPGPGEVRIRVSYCGVCGSDIPRVYEKGTYRFPLVCGHEFAGVVETCGPGVDDLSEGDRVAVFPLLWCGECVECESSNYARCLDYDYLGSRSHGGFAEYVVAPRRNVIVVPEGVPLEHAAMTEPSAVALHALERGGAVSGEDTVAIFGAGPIGLMTAQWARALGAGQVVLFDPIEEKRGLAKELGFELAFSPSDGAESCIDELTGGAGASIAVDAAGVEASLLTALKVTARGGRAIMLGNPSQPVTLAPELISQLMRREVTIFGTWNSTYGADSELHDWRRSLDAMASRELELEPLITHRLSLEEGIDALEMMRCRAEFFVKVLIAP